MIYTFQILDDSLSPTLIKNDIVECIKIDLYSSLDGIYVIKSDTTSIQRIEPNSSIDLSKVQEIYRVDRLVNRRLL